MPEISVVSASGVGTSAVFSSAPAQGTLLVAFVYNSSAPAAASGWTTAGSFSTSGPFGLCVCKIAGASESTTQTPTTTASSTIQIWNATSLTGAFTSLANTFTSGHAANTTPPGPVTPGSITPTKPNAFALLGCMCGSGGASDTAPTSIGSMTNVTPFSGGNVGTGAGAFQANIGTSAYTGGSCTWTGSAGAASTVMLFVINPPEPYTQAVAASITPAGTVTRLTSKKSFSGSITPSSSLLTPYGLSIAGSITPAGSLSTLLLVDRLQVAQIGIEAIASLPGTPIQISQIAVERIKSYQTVPIQVSQIAIECISPTVRGFNK